MESAMKSTGESIISLQMLGLVVGGICWGMLGDKKGRKSVLFGSILLYSLATIANGFVQTPEQYTWLRFIAGLGLAGNWVPASHFTVNCCQKKKRTLQQLLLLPAGWWVPSQLYIVYAASGENWRLCYFIGGGMGLALLFLRVRVLDSAMYDTVKKQKQSWVTSSCFLPAGKELFAT